MVNKAVEQEFLGRSLPHKFSQYCVIGVPRVGYLIIVLPCKLHGLMSQLWKSRNLSRDPHQCQTVNHTMALQQPAWVPSTEHRTVTPHKPFFLSERLNSSEGLSEANRRLTARIRNTHLGMPSQKYIFGGPA